MDEEKFQRAIDIILEQQATFYSGLQELQEIQKGAEKRTNVLERVCLNLYNSSVEQHNTTVEQGKNIAQLSVDIREMREAQRKTDEQMRDTDGRLNAVIFMAEKFFSGETENPS